MAKRCQQVQHHRQEATSTCQAAVWQKPANKSIIKCIFFSAGNIWVEHLQPGLHHNSLMPPGEGVRAAGEMTKRGLVVDMNGRSGHYFAEQPLNLSEGRLFERDARRYLVQNGLTPRTIVSDSRPLPEFDF